MMFWPFFFELEDKPLYFAKDLQLGNFTSFVRRKIALGGNYPPKKCRAGASLRRRTATVYVLSRTI